MQVTDLEVKRGIWVYSPHSPYETKIIGSPSQSELKRTSVIVITSVAYLLFLGDHLFGRVIFRTKSDYFF